MKRIAVLGSTGSIGTSTLRVVEAFPERFRVAAIAAAASVDRLEEQARRFRPERIAVADPEGASELRRRLGGAFRVEGGAEALVAAALHEDVDLVVCAVVGAAGLRSTWAAIDAGRDVALANKESLVVGGALLTARAAETGERILPVDC